MATKEPGVWGIDLGQCALKAVRLEKQDGKIVATAFDYVEHPKILSQPDADPDQLAREALEQFLSRNDIKEDKVVISVPGQSGLARFVKLPPVEEKKIDAIVTFEAKQQIPFPLEEVVWDYQKISKGTVSEGFALEAEIGLFAMKRDTVNRALQQFKEVNVEVDVVQMAPLALCNFIGFDQLKKDATEAEGEEEEKPLEQDCVVALDIGTDNSNLVITDGENIIWQRPIPLGGNHFTRTLTKELKLTFAKAEHIKRNAIKSPDLRKILTALRPVLNDFVSEVQRSLGYFTNTHRRANITHMIGLGNVFRLPGLQKFLKEKLQIDVVKFQKFDRLEGDDVTKAPQFSDNIMSFAVAYGLAVQGLGVTRVQTNLLPQEIRVERMIRAKKPWAVAAAAALLLAVGGLTFGRSVQYSVYSETENPQVKKAIGEGKSAVDLANSKNSQYASFEEEAKKNELAVKRIGSGVDQKLNWVQVMKYVNDMLPQPTGYKVPISTDHLTSPRKTYWTKEAYNAYMDWSAKRNPVPGADAGQEKKKEKREEKEKREKELKENLILLNIEGVSSVYAEDLTIFFDRAKEETKGFVAGGVWIHDKDKAAILKKTTGSTDGEAGASALPKSGWVFEIRGHTYHKAKERLVIDTLIANLRNPEKMPLTLPGQDGQTVFYKVPDAIKETVQKNISFAFLYKSKYVQKPFPNQYVLINKSHVRGLINKASAAGGGGFVDPGAAMPGVDAGTSTEDAPGGAPGAATPLAKTRASWTAVGEVASQVMVASAAGAGDGGPGMPGAPGAPEGPGNPTMNDLDYGQSTVSTTYIPPRTEFVVVFIWAEPLGPESQAAAEPAVE